ncbi:hypothetical protein ACFQV2_11150 [Actinokineospora soli]|uniref:Uncharacterized protein n=1 Tax=Actinokineospora soli TaxID=1048753 RepID=A0ABW2TM44_9PSEU
MFVMAMEPDIVAAHVETAYAELAARVGGEGGELGWRFLEKIVQLPMGLPAIDTDAHLPGYLRGLLGVRAEAAPEPVPGAVVPSPPQGPPLLGHEIRGPVPVPRLVTDTELVEWAERRLRGATLDTLDQVAVAVATAMASGHLPDLIHGPAHVLVSVERATEIARAAADRVHAELFARSYTDDQALTAIGAALPALGTPNPREIKRYVNLFRFYSFIVAARRSEITAVQIAKIAGLAIRWPDLLTTLARDDTLTRLEREDDDAWDGLRAAQPRLDALRAFLRQGPRISEAARLLL